MKINAVFLKKSGVRRTGFHTDDAEKSLILIFAIMMVSVIFGALAYTLNRNAFGGEIWNCFVSLLTNTNGKTLIEIFSGFYIIDLFVLFLLTVFATASFGSFPAIITVFFRTVGIGTIGAYLFANYSFTGLKYYLLIILPGKVILFFGLLLAAQNCLRTSKKTKQIIDGKTVETIDRKLFFFRNAVCGAIFALSALTDTCLMYFLSGKFNF